MRNYSVLVPSGYTLVDLEGDVAAQSRAIAERVVLGLGTPVRRRAQSLVASTLEKSFTALGADGSFAALLSVAPLAEQALRPMVVFSRFRPKDADEPLDAIVAMAAIEPGATLLEVEDMVGLRVERTDDVSASEPVLDARLPRELLDLADAEPGGRARMVDAAAHRRARRVHYFLGHPADEHSWVHIQGSVQVADDPMGEAFADAFVGVFDLVTKTFRWEGDDE